MVPLTRFSNEDHLVPFSEMRKTVKEEGVGCLEKEICLIMFISMFLIGMSIGPQALHSLILFLSPLASAVSALSYSFTFRC